MKSLKETLLLAIQNEILSQNLYSRLAAGFQKNPAVASTLQNLVPLEKMHEDKLRAVFRAEFPNEEPKVDTVISHKNNPDDLNDPVKVLEFAISREVIAHETYIQMASQSDKAELTELLNELATEEENHKIILETEILRIDGLMTWFDPSELNGLVED